MFSARSLLWSNLRASIARPKCVVGHAQSQALRFQAHTRFYASRTSEVASHAELSNPKPKAATQLRRTAARSNPIRANPAPTRSDIRPVSILTTADRYLLPQLRRRLPESAIRLQSAWWIPRWAGPNGREGEIFVFGNGSIVCWGLEELDAQKFAKDFLRGSTVEVGRLK